MLTWKDFLIMRYGKLLTCSPKTSLCKKHLILMASYGKSLVHIGVAMTKFSKYNPNSLNYDEHFKSLKKNFGTVKITRAKVS